MSLPEILPVRLIVLGAAVILALTTGCTRKNPAADGSLTLSGNIEVIDAQLAFKIPGRVIERTVSEGENVQVGQRVAQLEDVEQTQELALREAELAATEAMLAELLAGSRPQEIAAAAAGLRSAEAERDRARLEFTRQQELLAQSAVPIREFETAQAQLNVAEARVGEISERLKLVQEGPRRESIQQAKARRDQASALVALAKTRVAYTQLTSPLAGVVLAHHIEAGEYVSPGTPVLSVADTRRLWVRTYIDQTDLGHIRLGQKVAVRIDSFAEKSYEGTVSFIASEAEFTPKSVQTAKERVKLVFRVKVDVANPHGELKPGMPADVLITRDR